MSCHFDSDRDLSEHPSPGRGGSTLATRPEPVLPVLRELRLDGMLSFAPGSEPFELHSLNVLIGPNGSGKSNLIEALRLLSATPTDLGAAVRTGGGPDAWVWKGEPQATSALIEVVLDGGKPGGRSLRYRLEVASSGNRLELVDEGIERLSPNRAVASNASSDRSLLAQGNAPAPVPEVIWVGETFGDFQFFGEWAFGQHAPVRDSQPTHLRDDRLLPDSSNLALVLNRIELADEAPVSKLVRRFFPRFERLSTQVSGGSADFFLHEPSFRTPIPAARLSDGTLRFVALLAALHAPSPPRLLCIDNPELGLHPDSVALLADELVAASQRMQLVVTTHSDALVSALSEQPEAIVACERPGAATELRRLDLEKLGTWLNEYSLGDVWRMGALGANP